LAPPTRPPCAAVMWGVGRSPPPGGVLFVTAASGGRPAARTVAAGRRVNRGRLPCRSSLRRVWGGCVCCLAVAVGAPADPRWRSDGWARRHGRVGLSPCIAYRPACWRCWWCLGRLEARRAKPWAPRVCFSYSIAVLLRARRGGTRFVVGDVLFVSCFTFFLCRLGQTDLAACAACWLGVSASQRRFGRGAYRTPRHCHTDAWGRPALPVANSSCPPSAQSTRSTAATLTNRPCAVRAGAVEPAAERPLTVPNPLRWANSAARHGRTRFRDDLGRPSELHLWRRACRACGARPPTAVGGAPANATRG